MSIGIDLQLNKEQLEVIERGLTLICETTDEDSEQDRNIASDLLDTIRYELSHIRHIEQLSQAATSIRKKFGS